MSKTYINLGVARYDELLSWDQATVDRLLRRAFEVAIQVGCHIERDDQRELWLKEIEGNGGRVDWQRLAVVPTEAQLDEVCELLRATAPSSACRDPVVSGGFQPVGVGNGGNMFFDWDNWAAKAPTAEDLIWVCRWAQGNPDVGQLFDPFMPKDIDIVLEPMFTYAVLGKYCRKPVYHAQATEPLHVTCLDEMSRTIERHRGYRQQMNHYEYVNPPFRLGGRGIRTMLARVDTGICDRMGIGPMSVSGMSAPVTVAGAAVTAAAETLTALNVLHLLRPEPGLTTVACTGQLDVATARVSFFASRTHLQNVAIAEIFRRGVGADCSFLTWYRDTNEPGLQACHDFGCAQAFFSALRARTYPEIGGLSCGNMFSPEQAVMDIEIIKEFDELLSGFDASDQAVAMADIVAAGFQQGYHLTTGHMMANMREHAALSDFFLRGYPAGAGHDRQRIQTRQLMELAREKSLAAHAAGAEIEPDNELGDELWEAVVQAAREIGAEVPAKP